MLPLRTTSRTVGVVLKNQGLCQVVSKSARQNTMERGLHLPTKQAQNAGGLKWWVYRDFGMLIRCNQLTALEHYSSAHNQWRFLMSPEQAMSYVYTLNTLFVNKVITRAEFRAALKDVPLFGAVCSAPKAKQRKRG
jgi:hypothetical protein